jgi:hypothetical protein
VGVALVAVLNARSIFRPDLTHGAQALMAAWVASFGLLLWGFYFGRASFIGLAHGELFARRTILGLRNLALGIFLFKIASPVLLLGVGLLTSFPANMIVTIKDLAESVFTLVSLGAIVLIATVLTRAAEIAEDNAQIV